MGTDNQVTHPVIFFDGVCNLCNASVSFIIKRDRKKLFHFSSLQSSYAKNMLAPSFTQEGELQSLVMLKDGHTLTRSTAALTIARHLSGLWPALYAFIILPRFLRDPIYDLIARNRYRLFGKKNECMIPAPGVKDQFIN